MDVPEKLFTKYKVPVALLSTIDAKRDLLSKMLIRDTKIIGGSEPILAEALLPQVQSLSEEKLDALLEPRIYKETPASFDPKTRQRPRETPIELFAQFERLRLANARYRWSVKKVAKHLHPKLKERFGTPESLARTHFKNQQMARNLQKLRSDPGARSEVIRNLIAAYQNDGQAMLLLSSLARCARTLEMSGSEEEATGAGRVMDAIFEHGHPFIDLLMLAASSMPVSDLWMKTNDVFEKIRDEDLRKKYFAELGLNDQDPDKFIDSVLKQFKQFKLG